MKQRFIFLSPFLLVFVLSCLLPISCASEPSIVGYWQDTQQNNLYIEFTSDGKSIIDDGEMLINCKYEFISEHYIKFSNPLFGVAYELGGDTLKYQLSGDTLTVGGDNSKTFKRIR